jgi:hypothetical protein
VAFEVLTAASMKMAVFWDVASCSLILCDVSEELTAFIITVITLHGATSQKTAVFIFY